jgi:ribonuclease VapC
LATAAYDHRLVRRNGGYRQRTGYEGIVHELAASPGTWIGAPTQLEIGIVLTARVGPRGKTVLARFLQANGIQTVAFDEEHAAVALDAYSRFGGKGRHPAALNFGDCCTYATASVAGEQLLCVGTISDRLTCPWSA